MIKKNTVLQCSFREKIVLLRAIIILFFITIISCTDAGKNNEEKVPQNLIACEILGNPHYMAISYGGYRKKNRDIQPTIGELKEDMKILSAMGIHLLRTYNVHFDQAANLLKAISSLKKEDPTFEMYVMLGAWIDCKNAFNWEAGPDHEAENERNEVEVKTAVSLAQQYPDIIKIIAVGNESMVHWAAAYFVRPKVILKYVNVLQNLKKEGKLSKDLWITSSDDFASWGGGDTTYHTDGLEALYHAVDYISMHTYPYHNSHYNPNFWAIPDEENDFKDLEKVDAAMIRARDFAIAQYESVLSYMKSIGVSKPIHIGETGWATNSNGHYGEKGSRATDEYKQGLYYKHIREWTKNNGISCFYFEAFDEQWKDAENSLGSENHFGLINFKGEAKYPLWNLVDQGVFKGLKRDGNKITKTFGGNIKELQKTVLVPNTNYSRTE